MRGAPARPLYDPQRLRRHLLRVHQPHAGDRDARLRRHGDGLCARMPDGQARPSGRHRPDGVPHPQRLSRRRHEGAPARGQEHRADRMRPGRRRKGQVAAARRGQADVVAQGRRRQPGGDIADAARARSAARRGFAAANHLRSRAAATIQPPPPAPTPPPPRPQAPSPSHGAARFSSVFGTRRR